MYYTDPDVEYQLQNTTVNWNKSKDALENTLILLVKNYVLVGHICNRTKHQYRYAHQVRHNKRKLAFPNYFKYGQYKKHN